MKIGAELKPGQLEVVWLKNDQVEVVDTNGMAYNGGAIVCDMGKNSKLIIPFTAVKRFRIRAVGT